MGLADYVALHREYERGGPPMRLMLALYVGWKPPKPRVAEDVYSPEDLANFLSQFPGGEFTKPPSDGTT